MDEPLGGALCVKELNLGLGLELGLGLDVCLFSPEREWAVPGGTARPGQPVEKSEQAPASSPSCKNQFNIDGPQWGPYQILS